MPWKTTILLLILLVAVVGCASSRPILYPNEQLKRVGADAANRDVDDCLRQAENYVPSNGRAGKVAAGAATSAATSSVVGAAAGAAGGSIVGRAGTGAAIGGAGGAAGGATRGFLHGISGKNEPTPVQKNFVNRCLREKGYSPIGWE
ncbi:MAG TPA: hypothetical protein VMT22_15355 [Terriglobales bacterium]|jgi:hypothetical protein|nr:hypothetical protein [Terriglobales bacterium]